VIGNQVIQLAISSLLIEPKGMKTRKSIHIDGHRQLLLMVPVIFSMAFAGCSDVAGTPGKSQAVNLQSAVTGAPQTGDNVTIGPATYNPQSRGFDRPWPFGPEAGAQ
jgi:hypothetical protein